MKQTTKSRVARSVARTTAKPAKKTAAAVVKIGEQKRTKSSSPNLRAGKKQAVEAIHNQYNEESIKSLDWREHIRLRPGMYIGKLGDGSSMDDGIYILVKEVIDNCIDEYTMGYGKRVDLKINDGEVTVRDFGRGIPLGKVV